MIILSRDIIVTSELFHVELLTLVLSLVLYNDYEASLYILLSEGFVAKFTVLTKWPSMNADAGN